MTSARLHHDVDIELTALEHELDTVLSTRTRSRILEELATGAWIYGAGMFGQRIAALLKQHNLPILGFIDRRGAVLREVNGFPVTAPSDFTPFQAQAGTFVMAISSPTDVTDVIGFARSLPFKHVVLTADLPDAFGEAADNYWLTSRSFLKDNFASLRSAAHLFHDEVSLRTLTQLIRYRITGDSSHHPTFDLEHQYFPPDLPGFDHPITLVDGGAFDGDTFRSMIAHNIPLRHWIAFEPDEKNFAALSKTAAQAECAVTLFPCGLSDRQHQIHFSNDGKSSSKITLDGSSEITIQCVALDAVLQGQQVDYIKLDIEGAELSALAGMAKTIERCRPRLAISAYHKPDDLWEIARTATQIVPAARLFLRQHAGSGFESVIYALPEEQCRTFDGATSQASQAAVSPEQNEPSDSSAMNAPALSDEDVRRIQFLENLTNQSIREGHGVLISYQGPENPIEITKERQKILLSPRNYFYAWDLMFRFDDYFGASQPARTDNYDVVDYSMPRWHKTRQSEKPFFFTSFAEGDDESSLYLQYLNPRPGEVVLDIGSYCGLSVLTFAKAVGKTGRVFAFEADAENYAALLKNIECQELENVRPFNLAVTGEGGKAWFSGEANMGSRVIADAAQNRDTLSEVDTITLTDILTKNHLSGIDVIKMDIEGAEYEVIEKSRKFINRSNARWLIEIHRDPMTGASADVDRVRRIFDYEGYCTQLLDKYQDQGMALLFAQRVAPSRNAANNALEIAVTNVAPRGDHPTITVVLCCYSHKSYFLEAAESILNQSAKPTTFIIHNNGANEDYTALINSFAAKNDIKVIETRPNTYGISLRCDVLPFIETDYVAFLHDDDVYHPQKIELSLEALTTTHADYVVTNMDFIDDAGKQWTAQNEAVNPKPYEGSETRGQLLAEMVIPPGRVMHFSTLVMKTHLARKTLLGDPLWPRIADGLFWGSLYLDPNIDHFIVTKPLSKIRIHGANDRLYEKYPLNERWRQYMLLALSEIEFVRRILARASDDVLVDFLSKFMGSEQVDDPVRALVGAAVEMDRRSSEFWYAKQGFIPLFFHKAFELDPLQATALVHEFSGKDANHFMQNCYARQMQVLFDSCKNEGITRPVFDHSLSAMRWALRHPRKFVTHNLRALRNMTINRGNS